jgi:isopenicillin-N N-acyltransferase-like protein
MRELPILELGDAPYERGLDHGRAMRDHIREVSNVYLARFALGGIDQVAAEREGEAWMQFMREDNPEYFSEMEGIAAGADIALRDIVLLNARYEVTYSIFSQETRAARALEPDGCTCFGLMPETTASSHTILGQNWDWLAGLAGRTFVARVRRREKPDFIGYAEAGIVGCKNAVNEHGIGLCVNGLVTAEDGKHRYRKPLHVRCRELIDAARFDLALLPFLQTDRVCSANILVGQAEGEIINLELTPDAANYLFPRDGIIVHANHMVHPRSLPSQLERIAPNTLYRDIRVERGLRRRAGTIDAAAIREVMSDHYSYPAAVCRHEDPELPAARRMITVACIALDLDARVLSATGGQPCKRDLVAYPLYPERGSSVRAQTEEAIA